MKKFIFFIAAACMFCFSAANAAKYPGLKGKIVREIPFSDATGSYVVVHTENTVSKDTDEIIEVIDNRTGKIKKERGFEGTREMFVYLYRIDGGRLTKVWRIYDFQEFSDGVNGEINLVDLRVTDVDKNGKSEVWATYQLYGNDVAVDMKIIMYEGKQKYAMRGGFEALNYGKRQHDVHKADGALRGKPVFLRYAEQLWNSH